MCVPRNSCDETAAQDAFKDPSPEASTTSHDGSRPVSEMSENIGNCREISENVGKTENLSLSFLKAARVEDC